MGAFSELYALNFLSWYLIPKSLSNIDWRNVPAVVPGTFAFITSSCHLDTAAGVPAEMLVALLNVCASLLLGVCTDPWEPSVSVFDQKTDWTEEHSFPTYL